MAKETFEQARARMAAEKVKSDAEVAEREAAASFPQVTDELFTGGPESVQTFTFPQPNTWPHIETHLGITVMDRYALTVIEQILQGPSKLMRIVFRKDRLPKAQELVNYAFDIALAATKKRAEIIAAAKAVRAAEAAGQLAPGDGDDGEGPDASSLGEGAPTEGA